MADRDLHAALADAFDDLQNDLADLLLPYVLEHMGRPADDDLPFLPNDGRTVLIPGRFRVELGGGRIVEGSDLRLHPLDPPPASGPALDTGAMPAVRPPDAGPFDVHRR
jgi:hypothetical protein